MKLFVAEDFLGIQNFNNYFMDESAAQQCANLANSKLEYESQVVYGNFGINNHNEITHENLPHMHKALLVNIEEVPQTVRVEMTKEEFKAYNIYKLNKSLIKADFGPDASKTYKDDLFEECIHSKIYYDTYTGVHRCMDCSKPFDGRN